MSASLRELMLHRAKLIQEMVDNGGEIPLDFDKNDIMFKEKIDNYVWVRKQFEDEIQSYKNKADILRMEIEKLDLRLNEAVLRFGEPGGTDGKLRIMGADTTIKDATKTKRKFVPMVTTPQDFLIAKIEMPFTEMKEFYPKLAETAVLSYRGPETKEDERFFNVQETTEKKITILRNHRKNKKQQIEGEENV